MRCLFLRGASKKEDSGQMYKFLKRTFWEICISYRDFDEKIDTTLISVHLMCNWSQQSATLAQTLKTGRLTN